MIDLLARLLTPRRRVPVPPPPDGPATAEDADEAPAGCGWFDSSHELRAGLVVVEHASADAVAASLPLDDWLRLHLGAGERACGAGFAL